MQMRPSRCARQVSCQIPGPKYLAQGPVQGRTIPGAKKRRKQAQPASERESERGNLVGRVHDKFYARLANRGTGMPV